MKENKTIIIDLLKALLINNGQQKKNKKLQKKWLTYYQESLELQEDLEFQKDILERVMDSLTYKDRCPNDAKNREG